MDKITHEMRLMQWTIIVRECRSSGMTVKSWCIENNVSEKQFYYWQRRIRGKVHNALEKAKSKSGSAFVQLQVPVDSSRDTSAFAWVNQQYPGLMEFQKLSLIPSEGEDLKAALLEFATT